MRDLLGGFLTLLAPIRCAACDEASEWPSVFCNACATLIDRMESRGAVFEYGGPVANAIQRFKYEGHSELGGILGSVMVEGASQ